MNILITGAKGFVGKNLIAELKNIRDGKAKNYPISIDISLFEYDIDNDPMELDIYCKEADFVFNLAGVNRTSELKEFNEGNFNFTSTLINTLKKYGNTCPLMISSSTQAALNNPYGQSKKAGEDLVFTYAKETGAKVFVYRFPNIFGKWCRPNYNSGVATFCHNIVNDLPITISNRDNMLHLVYIDDVMEELIGALQGNEHREVDYCFVPTVHTVTLGNIVDLLYSFKASRENLSVPNMADAFTFKLYATYMSYLPGNKLSYSLKENIDTRGSFTEIFRIKDRGQFSINIAHPHICRGNHWHHSCIEKFLVVNGKGVIRLREVNSEEVNEYFVSGNKLEIVDIPVGYTHNIENIGDTDMVTFMWSNKCFDPNNPDTFFEKV
ncbi:MAG: capsular biosynthesis protein [Bacteroidetes bacterium GWF2_40_14]|nr:MAG: capsular biosynthesis protein [Bacteroidetes bacterium GWF2_40_14]